jgi:hypothetical protein
MVLRVVVQSECHQSLRALPTRALFFITTTRPGTHRAPTIIELPTVCTRISHMMDEEMLMTRAEPIEMAEARGERGRTALESLLLDASGGCRLDGLLALAASDNPCANRAAPSRRGRESAAGGVATRCVAALGASVPLFLSPVDGAGGADDPARPRLICVLDPGPMATAADEDDEEQEPVGLVYDDVCEANVGLYLWDLVDFLARHRRRHVPRLDRSAVEAFRAAIREAFLSRKRRRGGGAAAATTTTAAALAAHLMGPAAARRQVAEALRARLMPWKTTPGRATPLFAY